MRIAHLADLHLGYGANGSANTTRQHDVLTNFHKVVTDVIAQSPDALVVAGDTFHTSKPSPHVVCEAFREFARIGVAMTGKPFIIIGGNHDTSPVSSDGTILPLFESLGAKVASYRVAEWKIGDTWFRGVPERAKSPVTARGAMKGRQVLVLHGEVAEMPNAGPTALSAASLADWDYVALGHYHVHSQWGHVVYAGSIDYTSSDPWHEGKPKGWVLWDTDTRHLTFVQSYPRPHIDLPVIDARGLGEHDVILRCEEALTGLPAGAVVRQIVGGADVGARRDISQLAAVALADSKAPLLSYRLVHKPLADDGTTREGMPTQIPPEQFDIQRLFPIFPLTEDPYA